MDKTFIMDLSPTIFKVTEFSIFWIVGIVSLIVGLSLWSDARQKGANAKSALARVAIVAAGLLAVGYFFKEIKIGPLELRYYGIIFATMLYTGFLIWRKQTLRGGYSPELADRFLIWGVVAVLAGSRLGHCLFYEPARYLSDPISILYFWKGGLASHGATVGLVVAMLAFSIKYKLRFLEVLDRASMPSAVGAAAVRLGNFFNSEIVGRATDGSWGVKFPRYDCHYISGNMCQVYASENHQSHPVWIKLIEEIPARHPSQLYEFGLGMFVLFSLFMADKLAKKENRPLGMMAGLFLTLYFAGRFSVEFFKEYQTLEISSSLTMGQYLSIVPFSIGVGLLIWVAVKRVITKDGLEERLARAVYIKPEQEKVEEQTKLQSTPKSKSTPKKKNRKK